MLEIFYGFAIIFTLLLRPKVGKNADRWIGTTDWRHYEIGNRTPRYIPPQKGVWSLIYSFELQILVLPSSDRGWGSILNVVNPQF